MLASRGRASLCKCQKRIEVVREHVKKNWPGPVGPYQLLGEC